MKKTLIIAIMPIVVGLSAGAQKLDTSKVPAAVKTAFTKQHPGLTAKWEKENGQFEAGFKQNGQIMSVLYLANGTMTETEVDIKVSDLPIAVSKYVKEYYKGATIKEAAKITKADGTVHYEAEVNKMDVLFDVNGRFLKEVKDQ